MQNHREKDRGRRIAQLNMAITQAAKEGDIDDEKLIMKFSAFTGTSRRTILEYLKVLEIQGLIKREFGVIFVEKKEELIINENNPN